MIGKDIRKIKKKEISQSNLILMWFILFFGYFLFVLQWYSIGNFSSGYLETIGKISNPFLNSMQNWTITLMRGIGSIFASYLLLKIGHKYAVITVLSLMALSFPYIIFASVKAGSFIEIDGNKIWPINFIFFLIFRLFLAIGGTTLIIYTNPIIARMNDDKRPKFININAFAFNLGAFFSNVFFCFGISGFINSNMRWILILIIMIIFIFVILIIYIFFGKNFDDQSNNKKIKTFTIKRSFTSVLKQTYTWKLGLIFGCWVVSAILINSSLMRKIIEESPANFSTLINWNKLYGHIKIATSISETYLGDANSVVMGNGYQWVWPAFVSLFVSGLIVGYFLISSFSKTIYKRKKFLHFVFFMGYLFAGLSIVCGYFGGYENKITLSLFLIFIFISGIFLWGAQPLLLSNFQQSKYSSPEFSGTMSGFVWGIGYIFYTLVEIIFSVILTVTENNSLFNLENITNIISNNSVGIYKEYESIGVIVVFSFLFIVLSWIFIPIELLPKNGIFDKNGNFIEFTKEWKIINWNFYNKDVLISC